ncbi:DNA/RNA non-specific endonuclease [Labilibaculum euxinus]|uniref:Endonuclease n=1 Tax=Labilibaculum euxinus TaxID=2686357 RepID=A0A7M4DAA6_9BACT|nr:DNA/RNA non-specific endonuclease [Labilibaculum euxinus]MUP39585.1 DNA/RNA non-specific endonuclease [Labilibaculum euxinus]MVB08790.1 DNA/RNA non-specific endonuclease [Labilibaculum euxinus]
MSAFILKIVRNIVLSAFYLLPPFFSFGQEYLPISNGEIVHHTYYTLSYSEDYEQANWVYYKLRPEHVLSWTIRRNYFKPDTLVSTYSAELKDYKGNGYDRGHLCPAAAMKINQVAIKESFLMSNISPQHPGFNKGIWKELEKRVRYWTYKEKELHVVTGPIFDEIIDWIGDNKVAVPGSYFKVIFDPTDDLKMLAFILPNKKIDDPLTNYVVSVDSVESRTGINFFSQLELHLQDSLKSNSDYSLWYSKKYKLPFFYHANSEVKQCNGISKYTNERCKSRTSNKNGYCTKHQYQNVKEH